MNANLLKRGSVCVDIANMFFFFGKGQRAVRGKDSHVDLPLLSYHFKHFF